MFRRTFVLTTACALTLTLAGCGGFDSFGSLGGSAGSIGSGPFSGGPKVTTSETGADAGEVIDSKSTGQVVEIPNGETIVIEQSKRRTFLAAGAARLRTKFRSTNTSGTPLWTSCPFCPCKRPIRSPA